MGKDIGISIMTTSSMINTPRAQFSSRSITSFFTAERLVFIVAFLQGGYNVLLFLFLRHHADSIRGSLHILVDIILLALTLLLYKQKYTRFDLQSRFRQCPLELKVLFFYILWSLMTFLWNKGGNVYMETGVSDKLRFFFMVVEVAIQTITVFLLMYLLDIKNAVVKFFQGLSLSAISMCLTILVFRDQFGDRLGDLEHRTIAATEVSTLTAYVLLVTVWLFIHVGKTYKQKLFYGFAILLEFYSLFSGLGKTALISGSLFTLIYILLTKRISFKAKLFSFAGLLAVFGAVQDRVFTYFTQYALEMERIGESVTGLSGRTEYWKDMLERIPHNLLWGHGLNLEVGGHNEILGVLYSYGLIGLLLMLWITWIYVQRCLNLSRKSVVNLYFCINENQFFSILLLSVFFLMGTTSNLIISIFYMPLPLFVLMSFFLAQTPLKSGQEEVT